MKENSNQHDWWRPEKERRRIYASMANRFLTGMVKVVPLKAGNVEWVHQKCIA